MIEENIRRCMVCKTVVIDGEPTQFEDCSGRFGEDTTFTDTVLSVDCLRREYGSQYPESTLQRMEKDALYVNCQTGKKNLNSSRGSD